MRAAVACGLASSSGSSTPGVGGSGFLRPSFRSFVIKSLTDFAAGLDQDFLLLPVRMLRKYPKLIASFIICSRSFLIVLFAINIFVYIFIFLWCPHVSGTCTTSKDYLLDILIP